MEKIKFDINKKPEIISGKYSVVTRDNNPVNIIGLILLKDDDVELVREFRNDGTALYDRSEYKDDLFLTENI